MKRSPERRRVCGCLLGLGLGLLVPAAALAARPFCRFSVRHGWGDDGPSEYVTHRAKPDDISGVPQVVARIKKALSFQANFDILIAQNEDNAFATVANGRKILVVDVGFLQKLNRIAQTEWAAIQVIAHELGHHIAGFSNDRHRSELNADYWSGQSLQRLNASRDAATRAILTAGTDFDTPTHPNKHRRATTIARGWDDAAQDRIDYSFCDNCR